MVQLSSQGGAPPDPPPRRGGGRRGCTRPTAQEKKKKSRRESQTEEAEREEATHPPTHSPVVRRVCEMCVRTRARARSRPWPPPRRGSVRFGRRRPRLIKKKKAGATTNVCARCRGAPPGRTRREQGWWCQPRTGWRSKTPSTTQKQNLPPKKCSWGNHPEGSGFHSLPEEETRRRPATDVLRVQCQQSCNRGSHPSVSTLPGALEGVEQTSCTSADIKEN